MRDWVNSYHWPGTNIALRQVYRTQQFPSLCARDWECYEQAVPLYVGLAQVGGDGDRPKPK